MKRPPIEQFEGEAKDLAPKPLSYCPPGFYIARVLALCAYVKHLERTLRRVDPMGHRTTFHVMDELKHGPNTRDAELSLFIREALGDEK